MVVWCYCIVPLGHILLCHRASVKERRRGRGMLLGMQRRGGLDLRV